MGMNLPHCPFSLETSRLTVSIKPPSPSLALPVELYASLPPCVAAADERTLTSSRRSALLLTEAGLRTAQLPC